MTIRWAGDVLIAPDGRRRKVLGHAEMEESGERLVVWMWENTLSKTIKATPAFQWNADTMHYGRDTGEMTDDEIRSARSEWHKYIKVEGSVYYKVSEQQGYNRRDYQVARIFGEAQDKEAIGKALRAEAWCGGASFNRDPLEADHGEVIGVTVWGCD